MLDGGDSMRKNVKGFTLIEMMIVVGIIAILAAVLVPNMLNSLKKAKVNTACTNAKLIFNATQTVAQEYHFKRDAKFDKAVILYSSSYPNDVYRVKDPDEGDATKTKEQVFKETLKKYYNDVDLVSWRVYIDHYMVKAVVAAQNDTEIYVGKYPTKNTVTLKDVENDKKSITSYDENGLKQIATDFGY
jgi:prepilin-type N-terminal cleavage/methylation domain-containing protein